MSVAVICICVFIVSTNRYFVLQNEKHNGQGEDESESGQAPLISSAYFQCDQQATCTHVVKFKETNKFGIILGHDQLAKIKEKVSAWKKTEGKDILVKSLRSKTLVPDFRLKVAISS